VNCALARGCIAALLAWAAAWASPLPAEAPPAPVELAFFYGQGCPHCAAMRDFLDALQARHARLQVRAYEIYADRANAQLLARVAAGYGAELEGVPMVFVGTQAFGGYAPEIAAGIERAVEACELRGCASPLARAAAAPPPAITLGAVLAAAAVDAINPCEMAVLLILLIAILEAGDRRRALYAGLAFSLAIFLSYYLMGLGLYSAVQAVGAARWITAAVAVLALLIGLFNLKDFFWYGKWFRMEVPLSWRPAMQRVIGRVTSVPGAFAVGFVVSLFLLPCTSGPYIVILGLLAQSTARAEAMLWLLLYNAVFIVPMLAITGAVYFGLTTPDDVEVWRTEHIRRLHLASGILLLLLGAAILAGMWRGWL
jgi:cytochrome c biogenesis protein CcdA/glutaredoxin